MSSVIPLKDIKNNTVVEVGLDEVAEMVASGHYALPKNFNMPILNGEGELGEINSNEYLQALNAGYAPAKSLDIQKALDVEAYGDSPLQTGLERATSAATFGASDFIASKLEPEYAERMRKREELNPGAAITGEIVGSVGPALLSGGTSLVAKAAAKTPVALATLAGETVTKGTAKLLAKNLPKNSLAAKIIAETVPRAAGLGIEGVLYGAGNYVSDASLGNADWSAESLISNVGMSGMLGAGLGAAIGGVAGVGGAALKKVSGWSDVNKLADDVVGLKTVRGQKIADKFEEGEIAKYIVNDVNKGKLTPFSSENLAEKAASTLDNNAKLLDDTLKSVEAEAIAADILPTRQTVLEAVEVQLNKLDSEVKVKGKVVPGQEGFATEIDKVRKSWQNYFADAELNKLAKEINPEAALVVSQEKITVQELNDIRKMIGAKGKFDSPSDAISLQINRELYPAFRQVIDSIADGVGQKDLLKDLNRKLSLGIKVQPFLDKAALQAEKSSILNLRDMVGAIGAGAGGVIGYSIAAVRAASKIADNEYVKSARLIYAVKAAERKMDTAINTGLRSFFLNSGKAVKASTLKLSTDAKEYDLYSEKVQQYANNPDSYLEHMSKRHIGVSRELPTVVASAEAKGLQAMQFLASKLPKPVSVPSLIPRKYIPSTQQRAQFMRYAEIVEDPKKALSHFQAGTLGKEHIEALKAIYPEMYKKISSSAAEYVSLHGQKLSYGKKIQLGIMLGIPTAASLQPDFINRLQAGYVPAADASQSAVNPTVGGLKEIDKSGRLFGETGE